MNTTTNVSSCSSPLNPTTKKIAETTALCLFLVVSLVGNCLVAFIVYQTKNMRKPINFFISNMAISDLLFPLIVFPRYLAEMYEDSWLISGTLGDVFCKVIPVLADIPAAVSVQSLSIDNSGSICSCGVSPSFPTLQFKAVHSSLSSARGSSE